MGLPSLTPGGSGGNGNAAGEHSMSPLSTGRSVDEKEERSRTTAQRAQLRAFAHVASEERSPAIADAMRVLLALRFLAFVSPRCPQGCSHPPPLVGFPICCCCCCWLFAVVVAVCCCCCWLLLLLLLLLPIQNALLSSPPEVRDGVARRAARNADDSFDDDAEVGRDRPVRRNRQVSVDDAAADDVHGRTTPPRACINLTLLCWLHVCADVAVCVPPGW
jgi:hypothetical protein